MSVLGNVFLDSVLAVFDLSEVARDESKKKGGWLRFAARREYRS